MDLSKILTTSANDLAMVSWSLHVNKVNQDIEELQTIIAEKRELYTKSLIKIVETFKKEELLPYLAKCREKLYNFNDDTYIVLKEKDTVYLSKIKDSYYLKDKFYFNFHSMELAESESDEDINYDEYGQLDSEVSDYLYSCFYKLRWLKHIEVKEQKVIDLFKEILELDNKVYRLQESTNEKSKNKYFEEFMVSLTIANLQQNQELRDFFQNIESTKNILAEKIGL